MPIESSSASRIAGAFALAAAAAVAAAAGPAFARIQEGKPAPTSATCRVCHTDPYFGATFGHSGLESSADGCFTCHADASAHVKARGGKGNVPFPARDLCLTCHEEETYGAPKHLEPKGRDARCTDCHVLHGPSLPARGRKPPAPEQLEEPVGPPPPPTGPMKFTGSVEAGLRFVSGDEGRYAQDVNLDDGARLFALSVEGESPDPLAPRFSMDLDGLGDPHAAGRLRLRKADRWKFALDARSDESPFVSQVGLHGGETLREDFGAGLDLRLSDLARLEVGYDRTDLEGRIMGTTFVNGVVLPAAISQDRVAQEAQGTLDLRGRAWHVKLRQGWLTEDADEDRDRPASAPGSPDTVAYDDDSSMDGPVTFAVAGFDALDGLLSVEARASRADLHRDVDTTEVRTGDLAGPYTYRASTTGERDRLVESQALDAALLLAKDWAFELSLERRTLREDGTVSAVEATTTSAGTAVRTRTAADRVSQRTTDERVGVRRTLGKDFHLRAGAEWLQDSLDRFDASQSVDLRATGFYAGAEGLVAPNLRVRGDVRTAHGTDVFTPLTPTDRDLLRLGASWQDPKGVRAGIDGGLSATESAGRTAASRGWDLRAWGGFDLEGGASVDAGWTVRKLSLSVDTLSYIGTSLAAGEAVSEVRSHVLDFRFAIPISAAVRIEFGGAFAVDRGTLPVRTFDATAGLRWKISGAFATRIEIRRREYDEVGYDALDYEATIVEVSVEFSF